MIVCPKCNKQLDDGTKFCGSCGTQIFGIFLCPNCGNQISTEFAFCPNCGSSIGEENPSKEKPKKKIPKNLFLFGGIGVFVVAAVVMITLFYRKTSTSSDYAFYIKDNELFLTDFTTNNSRQIVSGIFADDFDFDNNDYQKSEVDYLLNVISYAFSNLYTTSRNGELLFFIEEDGLYYKNIHFSDVEKKIDSNAYLYHVNDSATLVTYLTDNVLYQYDIEQKEKELIASNVSIFAASDDGHNIVYINNDNNIYVKYYGKETEMIDNGVSKIPYMTENLKTIYYIKDRSLYKKTDGSEKIKISSDVFSVLEVYDSGEIYYIKSDLAMATVYGRVLDDLKETEKSELRMALAEETMSSVTLFSLCYFNGNEEKVITDCFSYSSIACASDLPVIAFKAYNKVNLSEIDSIYDLRKIQGKLEDQMYVAIRDVTTVIEQSSASCFRIDSSGKTIYFIDDIPEDNEQDEEHGNLYKVTIKNEKAQEPELYDTNVFTGNVYGESFSGSYSGVTCFLENGDLMYFKDFKYDMGGDLFVNKAKIDDNVSWLSVNSDQNGNLVYYTGWNSDNNFSEDYGTSAGYGTLNIYENGKVRKVADNVRKYTVLPSGNILYLCDYNRYKGELYIDKKGKIQKIDTDVVDMIPCLDSAFRMGGYYYFLQNADDVLS